MAKHEKPGIFHPERIRWFRNVNILGALALAGVGVVVPQYQNILFLGGGINLAEAAGADILYQHKVSKQKLRKRAA